MNFDLNVITTNAIVIVPIVIAIVQAIKMTGWMQDHYSPLVAILVGVIIGWLGDHDNPDLTVTILSGAIYGLMASGLYSGVKTTMMAHMRKKAQENANQSPNPTPDPNKKQNSNAVPYNKNKC